MELGKRISKNDALKMLEITNACLSCKSRTACRKVIELYNDIIPFDYFVTGLLCWKDISFENMLKTSINYSFPSEYLKVYADNKYHFIDPLFQRFHELAEIQHSEDVKHLYQSRSDPVLYLKQDFGITNCYCYGLNDMNKRSATGVLMAGQQVKNNQRYRNIIKYLMPFLSIAIQSAHLPYKKQELATLTPTELEILKWLKEGKTAWEISMILEKSERTIRFHVMNILKKLNAMNRTHAVAIALENKILV